VPPRRPDARLFDKTVLIRGLWQGAGLLALLLGVYALAREFSKSDDIARAMTFSVLVLSNLALIFANRFWSQSALLAPAGSNHAFIWIAVATVGVLGAILGVPVLSGLFSFAAPSPVMLLAGVGAAGLSLLWFEAVKWGLGRRLALAPDESSPK
ncbi:MAG: cation-translocating P-type ATPase C-terminal domain-containing protein, partial [Burkholderiales bacterium]